MKTILFYLYRIYQICIAAPIILVATILTALVTMFGSWIGSAHFWGLPWKNLVESSLLHPSVTR